MDPNEAHRLLVVALKEHRYEEAAEYAEYICKWLDKGGFPPVVQKKILRPVKFPCNFGIIKMINKINAASLIDCGNV